MSDKKVVNQLLKILLKEMRGTRAKIKFLLQSLGIVKKNEDDNLVSSLSCYVQGVGQAMWVSMMQLSAKILSTKQKKMSVKNTEVMINNHTHNTYAGQMFQVNNVPDPALNAMRVLQKKHTKISNTDRVKHKTGSKGSKTGRKK